MNGMMRSARETLEKIKGEMRKTLNKKVKEKLHYEYRIKDTKLKDLEKYLMELYQDAFQQGVYVATWKGK